MKKKLLAFILALTLCLSMSVTAMADDYVSPDMMQVTVEGQAVNAEIYEYYGEEVSWFDIEYFADLAGVTIDYDVVVDAREFSIDLPDGYVIPASGAKVTLKDANAVPGKNYIVLASYWEDVNYYSQNLPATVTDGEISVVVTFPQVKDIVYIELKSEGNPTDTPSTDDNNSEENTENNNTNNNINIDNEVPDTSWMEKIETADLRLEDGKWLYYKDGAFDISKYAYVKFDDGIFLVANGVLSSEMNGLAVDPNSTDWYYLAGGQVQTQTMGLVMYDDAWFYVNAGRLDTTKSGCVAFDGSLFYVAAGKIQTDVSGLVLDPITNQWYFLANGQVQTQYTGLAEYNGEWFYVQNGALAVNYTGNVSYDGATFYVVNGMLK